jgi:hypothetical protein
MPAMSATQVHEEAAQPAETAGAATPSKMSRDVAAAREEKLTVTRMPASAAAAARDEGERAAWEAAYLAMWADM